MNKKLYGIHVVFVGIIYMLAVYVSNDNPYFALSFFALFLLYLILYVKRSRYTPLVPLITYVYPNIYILTLSPPPATLNNYITIIAFAYFLSIAWGASSLWPSWRRSIIVSLTIYTFLFLLAMFYELLSINQVLIRVLLIDPFFLIPFFTTIKVLDLKRTRLPKKQSYKPLPKTQPKVTFIIKNLPDNCAPVLQIDNQSVIPTTYANGSYILTVDHNCKWSVSRVICKGVTYYPDVQSGYANLGDTVTINFKPVSITRPFGTLQQTQSRLLSGVALTNWDPRVWINRKLLVYNVESVIGEGSNGYVLKASYLNNPVAIKVLKLVSGDPQGYFKDLSSEASVLSGLDHKNIVKVYAVHVDLFVINEILKGRTELYATNPPMIVMEYMEGGTLKDLLKDDVFYYSSNWRRAVLKALCETANALDYLHSQGLVHMDVKPQNIFLSKKPKDPSELDTVTFKLGDMGSVVRVNSFAKQLTPEYSPPEVLVEPVKPSSDIFALGMTGFVLLTRKIDRPDLNEMNNAIDCYIRGDYYCVKNEVEKAKMKLLTWDIRVEPHIDPLLRAMLSASPKDRPTARDVKNWLKKIDPTIC